ncbi:class I SAM-dependent methyltransferase [Nonomuraea sp. NPDC055795]
MATKVRLSGERATLLATLWGRALDARSSASILHDTMAIQVVEQIDFDFRRTGLRPGEEYTVALRARQIDVWAKEWLATRPEATVLHLGCGLDSRAWRLDPGPGVRWFDVDYPDVIELREKLYPRREHYTAIGSSVTDLAWLEQVPADRPVLVVAEGLVYYLREDEGRALFHTIVERFPLGQFVFETLSRRGMKLQKLNKAMQTAGAKVHWGIDSVAELESIHPRLRCVTTMSALDLDGYSALGFKYRLLAGLGRLIPTLRKMATFYRLNF